MQLLAEVEDVLALFTEGIAGRYYHIKSSDEFASHRRLALGVENTGQTTDTLYLPEQLDAPTPASYRVLVLEQIGLRECGTFGFRMAKALESLPELAERHETPRSMTARTGDFQLLFGTFDQPGLAADVFNTCEKARVLGHLRRTYPGANKHIDAYHAHLLALAPPNTDPFVTARRRLWGEGTTGSWQPFADDLVSLMADGTSVYDSVACLCKHYDSIREAYVFEDKSAYAPQEESLPDWLNREQRIEEWEEQVEQLSMAMAVEMLEAEQVEAERGQTTEEAVREADVDIKSLTDEQDTMKRRIDMERSAVQHALGADRSAARSFRYDEWNYIERRYLPRWCRVFEEPLIGESDEDTQTLNDVIKSFRGSVQKQLEQIRPTGLQRVTRVQDGDELDLNAIVEARQDIRSGVTPSERFYSRKERMHRDVCAAFLVDLSASTDDPIEPPEPFDWSQYDEDGMPNLRDPWDDPDEDSFDEEPKRKIIDIQREAMVVMASALDALGDAYGIYGFSGYGKDCVEIFVAKEPEASFSQKTLQAIAAMKPKRSTRMGPAIRHAVHKLTNSGHAMKVLMIISDGFPQDSDYGPDRGNHDYGVEDTAKAISEAQQKGVEVFCVTVDRSGHDYLKRMCPDSRYLIIEEIEDLPDQLSKVYTTLTTK